jgi:hypothetical protein
MDIALPLTLGMGGILVGGVEDISYGMRKASENSRFSIAYKVLDSMRHLVGNIKKIIKRHLILTKNI